MANQDEDGTNKSGERITRVEEGLKNLKEVMQQGHADIRQTLAQILVQTTATNGRVTELEKTAATAERVLALEKSAASAQDVDSLKLWRSNMSGRIAVIVAVLTIACAILSSAAVAFVNHLLK